MKKLTKSMKIVLVSIISAICVLGIVLGCILINKGNPNDPNNPSTPSGPVTPAPYIPKTWAEKVELLGKEASAQNNSNKSYDLIFGVPYENYVDEDNKLVELSSNYFVTKKNNSESEEKNYYIYFSNNNGTFNVKKVNESKSNGGLGEDGAIQYSVDVYNNSYFAIYNNLGNDNFKYSVFKLSQNSYSQIYLSSNEFASNKYKIFKQFEFSKSNQYGKFVVETVSNEGSSNEISYIVDLANNKEYIASSFSHSESNLIDYVLGENSLTAVNENTCYVYVLNNGKVLSTTISLESEEKFSSLEKLGDNKFIYVTYTRNDGSSLKPNAYKEYSDSVNYIAYSYKNIDVKANELQVSNLTLSQNNIKLNILNISDTLNFYSVTEQEVVNNELSKNRTVTYYYRDGGKLFSYSYEGNKNKDYNIIYATKDTILTKSGVYKLKSETELEILYSFDDTTKVLFSDNVNTDVFAVGTMENPTSEPRIIFVNMLGEVVNDGSDFVDSESKLLSIKDVLTDGKKYIIESGSSFYLVNNDYTLTRIDNPTTPNVEIYKFLNYDLGIYFTYENGSYKLIDYSNNVILSNFSSIEDVSADEAKTILKANNYILNFNRKIDLTSNYSASNYSDEVKPYDWNNSLQVDYYCPGIHIITTDGADGWWIDQVHHARSWEETKSLCASKGWSYTNVDLYGWEFQGWAKNTDDYNVDYKAGTEFRADNGYEHWDCYAVFKRTITVYYLHSNGTKQPSTATQYLRYTTKSSFVFSTDIVSRLNWTFRGYRDDTTCADYERTSYNPGYTSYKYDQNAVYSRSVTISYDGNGGSSSSGATISDTPTIYMGGGSSIAFSTYNLRGSSTFTRSGYQFSHWCTTASGACSDSTDYDAGETISPFTTSNFTANSVSYQFYARWKIRLVKVPVYYNWDGSDGINETNKGNNYLDLQSDDSVKTSNYYKNNDDYYLYVSVAVNSGENNIWFEGAWQSGSDNGLTEFGSDANSNALSTIPTRLGYTFDGYYSNQYIKTDATRVINSNGIVETFGKTNFITKDKMVIEEKPVTINGIHLYAHWSRKLFNFEVTVAKTTGTTNKAFIGERTSTESIIVGKTLEQMKSISGGNITYKPLYANANSLFSNNVAPVSSATSQYITSGSGTSITTMTFQQLFTNLASDSTMGEYLLGSKIELVNSSYVHIGWRVTNKDSNALAKDGNATNTDYFGYYLFGKGYSFTKNKTADNPTLEEYLRLGLKNEATTIYLCAIYEVRVAQINVGALDTNGSTSSVSSTNSGLIHNTYTDLKYEIKYPHITPSLFDYNTKEVSESVEGQPGNFTNDAFGKLTSYDGSGSYTIDKPALGTNITFSISLVDDVGVKSYAIRYLIFYDVPYYYGSDYGLATLKFELSFKNGSGSITPTFKRTDGTGSIPDIVSAGDNLFYIGDPKKPNDKDGFNEFKFTLTNEFQIDVKVSNINYLHKNSKISKETVYFSGDQHLKMIVLASPINEDIDDYDIVETKNGSDFETDLFETSGGICEDDEVAMPNGGYVVVPLEEGNDGKFYFWFNGVRHKVDNLSNTKVGSTSEYIPGLITDEQIIMEAYINRAKENEYYAYISLDLINNDDSKLRTNYANSEIFFIEPNQSALKHSQNNKVSESLIGTTYYQPTSYLSKLFETEIQLIKRIDGQAYNTYPSLVINNDKLKDTNWTKVGTHVKPSDLSFTEYYYNGLKYKVIEQFKYSGSSSTEYNLFLTQVDAGEHIGKILYILTGTGLTGVGKDNGNINNDTQSVLKFYMSAFENDLTVTIKKTNESDTYYADTKTEKEGGTYTVLYQNNYASNKITPASTAVLKINPNDGFLINKITLTFNGTTLLDKYLMGTAPIYLNDENNNKKVYLYSSQGIGGNTTPYVSINYSATSPKIFNSYNNYGGKCGIYYNYNYDGSWADNPPESFETIYILISGLYHDVVINVETISYFEFDFYGANLKEDGKLQFANNQNVYEDKFKDETVANSNHMKTMFNLMYDGTNNVTRLYFFGYASDFKNGISFFASGVNFSYYFTHVYYYGNSEVNPLTQDKYDDPENKFNSLYLSNDVGKDDDCLYFNSGTLNTFFNNSQIYGTNFDYRNYFTAKKYILMCEAVKHSATLTSQSLLKSSKGYYQFYAEELYYQVDDPSTKRGTWFNDTKVTNIGYTINGSIYDLKPREENYKYINWQESFETLKISEVDYDVIKITSDGFGFHIRYYLIPGYYLEKVGITYTLPTNDSTTTTTRYVTIGSSSASASIKDNTHCRFVNNTDLDYVDIYLYPDMDSSDTKYEQIKNCLNILAGTFKFDLYSSQISIKVNLDANTSLIDLKEEKKSNFNFGGELTYKDVTSLSTLKIADTTEAGKFVQTVSYDRITQFTPTLSMTGYTFVGWGSEEYYDDVLKKFIPRALVESGINTWNTTTSWTNVSITGNNKYTNIFDYLKRAELEALATTNLADVGYYSSDFYPAGGYFMTDTGFNKTRGDDTFPKQNYNFWSAYASVFQIVNYVSPSETVYNISLYGIWKPNTYYVSLNLNDSNASNGSTSSTARYGDLGDFNAINAGIILPNTLGTSSRFSYNSKAYDIFVIFDTDKWYMLADSNYSMIETQKTIAEMFADKDIVDFKQFVIDRYGYTWLGWFSSQLKNAFATNQYYNTLPSTKYPAQTNQNDSRVYSTAKYRSGDDLATGKSERFMTLDYSNFTTYFLKYLDNNKTIVDKDGSNVKEIKYTHFHYYNEFKYKENGSYAYNNLKTTETGRGSIYFYKYSDPYYLDNLGDMVIDNVATDKLSTYDYLNGYYSDVVYYDTMYDFDYFKYTYNDEGTDKTTNFMYFNTKIPTDGTSFRYLTLYSYWETNLYHIQVNFMDSDNSGIGGMYGSSTVNESSKVFLPAYFDDDNLYDRLKTFLPVRIGYDFVGWTFNPTNKTAASFEKQYLYLNTALTSYLYDNIIVYDSAVTYEQSLTSLKQEKMGDLDARNQVYLFAVWKVQTFSINISLNINQKLLKNLYDYDSAFALALYESTANEFDGTYTGIKTNWLKQNLSDEITFADIPANVEFIINFDQRLDTAVFKFGIHTYYLKDLFATSAGYYFMGWFINSICDPEHSLVTNNSYSSFDTAGALKTIINKEEKDFNKESKIKNVVFDNNFYNTLSSSTYTYVNNNQLVVSNTTLSEKDYHNGEGKINNEILNSYSDINYDLIDGYDYYKTVTRSSNMSTSFGYVTINGDNIYYLATEKDGNDVKLYFYDHYGTKVYLLPYIIENNENFIANNGSHGFTFDENNLYYNGNIIKFEVNGAYNAYYIDETYHVGSTYKKGDLNRLRIYFAYNKPGDTIASNNVGQYEIENGELGKYLPNAVQSITLLKTREFTLYANWKLKEDFMININNGNIGTGKDSIDITEDILLDCESESEFQAEAGQIADENYGLSGYYDIYNKENQNRVYTKSHSENGHMQAGIDMQYAFYDDLDLFISPYFDGRFLSEISFTFYAYEQLSDLTYRKMTYVLTLRFNWDSSAHNIKLDFWELRGVNGVIDRDAISNIITDENANVYIDATDNSVLSLLDKDILRNEKDEEDKTTFIKISDYIEKLIDYTTITHGSSDSKEFVPNVYDIDKDNIGTGRRDVNYVRINLYNLMSSTRINCKFAVQTYKLEIYNVFDSLGNTLEEVADKEYIVGYESFSEFVQNSKSAWSTNGTLSDLSVQGNENIDKNKFSSGSKLATIQNNNSDYSQSFDLPYGFYIYGKYYDANRRPVGVEYNPDKNIGYYESIYTGYKYIYDTGIYKYGDGTAGAIINNTNDLHSEQCSPILGSKTLFANSVREASSLYSFVSWYVPIIEGNEKISDAFRLIEYEQDMEASKINEDTIIVGYYFANNKPTSLQFYTWDDSQNAYDKYINNIEEYTLQSNTVSTKYALQNNELVLAGGDVKDYMDENNCAILYANETYGVDVATFGAGEHMYTRAEMADRIVNHNFIEENLIRNYWFYRYYYTYIEATIKGKKHSIRYDVTGSKVDDTTLHFYYLENESDLTSKRNYVQLLSTTLEADSLLIYVNDYNETKKIVKVTKDKLLSDWFSEIDMYNASYSQKYKDDLEGSEMFAYVPDTVGMDKYYMIKKIEHYKEDTNLTEEEKELLSKFYNYNEESRKHEYAEKTARFYVKIKNQIYYLLATTSSTTVNAKDYYQYFDESFTSSYLLNIEEITNEDSVTLKAVEIEGKKYIVRDILSFNTEENIPDNQKLNQTDRDEIEKLSVRPEIKYFIKYNNKIHYVFDDITVGESATFKTYTPEGFIASSASYEIVNIDNYFLKYENEFYPVEYTVMEDAYETEYYNPYATLNVCKFDGRGEEVEYYFNYSNKLFYHEPEFKTRVSTNGFDYKVYTPVNTNYRVKLGLPTENLKDRDIWTYQGVNINSLPSPNIGFWYNNETYDYVGYVDFKQSDLAYISSTVVKSEFSFITGKERIYDVFEDYVNIVYKNKPQEVRNAILEEIKKLAAGYSAIEKLQSSLITAGELITNKDNNSVVQVNLIIPVTFKFSYDVTVGNVNYKETNVSATVSVKYLTTIITKDTVIDETIFAIPIYSRNVMEFTDSSVKVEDSELQVSPKDMNLTYFENVGNIDTRYYNSDDKNYLQLAILDQTQFDLLKDSLNYPDTLTYLLSDKYKGDFESIVLSEFNTSINKVEPTITYNFEEGTLSDGIYYVVAYYEKMGNYDYVVRASDNVIKIELSTGSGNKKEVEASIIKYNG